MILIKGPNNEQGLMHYASPVWDISSLKEPSNIIMTSAKVPTKKELATLMHLLPQVVSPTYISGSGSDPEVFVAHANGEPMPAWEFLGAKPEHNYGTAVFWDGVQAEMSFGSGVSCHQELTQYVQRGLRQILAAAKTKDPTATIAPSDVVELPEKLLMTAADEHVALGCAPSTNPYGIEPLNIYDYRAHNLRYSGTHLHFSCGSAPPEWFPFGTAVMMDKVVGIVLTALGRDWEDPRRRLAYGRPGEHRVPMQSEHSYRLEYRTPGSFLLRAPQLFIFALDIARTAFRLGHCVDGRVLALPPAEHIIMACDADAAYAYMQKHEKFFTSVFRRSYGKDKLPALWKLLKLGAKASGLFNRTPESSWNLAGICPSVDMKNFLERPS